MRDRELIRRRSLDLLDHQDFRPNCFCLQAKLKLIFEDGRCVSGSFVDRECSGEGRPSTGAPADIAPRPINDDSPSVVAGEKREL
jgi:hypothetical protein